jgi:hypothetical protein
LYHLQMMDDAGLIEAVFVADGTGVVASAEIFRLTNAGHDFIEAARNATVWNKFKMQAAQIGGESHSKMQRTF